MRVGSAMAARPVMALAVISMQLAMAAMISQRPARYAGMATLENTAEGSGQAENAITFPAVLARAIQAPDRPQAGNAAFLQPSLKAAAAAPSKMVMDLSRQMLEKANALDELLLDCDRHRKAIAFDVDRVVGEVSAVNAGLAGNQQAQSEASASLAKQTTMTERLYDDIDTGRAQCAAKEADFRNQRQALVQDMNTAMAMVDKDNCKSTLFLQRVKCKGEPSRLEPRCAPVHVGCRFSRGKRCSRC